MNLDFIEGRRPVVNVSSIPQLSPFRYPGGKTWLVPYVRLWLASLPKPIPLFVEPFAGGGIITLTAIAEGYAQQAVMFELDDDIASVWSTVLNGKGKSLSEKIIAFDMTRESVDKLLGENSSTAEQQAFKTIVRNRINRGGILAAGAGSVKGGENGKGLLSRWYPETLQRRILAIVDMKERIEFFREDGIEAMRARKDESGSAFFIDPPYVVAGQRLYTHSDVDHEEIFDVAAGLSGDFLMTYDDAPEILALAKRYGFAVDRVPMSNTHHSEKTELVISKSLRWLPGS